MSKNTSLVLKAENNYKTSWFTQPEIIETKEEKKEPVIYPTPDEIQEKNTFWKFPELKPESNIDHKLHFRIKKAITTSQDAANWFDTVWMVLCLNARWNLNEVIIPEHLRSIFGGRSICVDGNWKKPGEVFWTIYL